MWGPARTYPPGEPKVPLLLARPDQLGTSCPGCVPLKLTYNPNTEPQAVELETMVYTRIRNHRTFLILVDPTVMTFASVSQFHFYLPWDNVFNVKGESASRP